MVTERDAYRLLGLTPEATAAEVRAAFRKRVMEQHPDTAREGNHESSVQDLVDAYRLLVGSENDLRDEGETSYRRIPVRRVARDRPRDAPTAGSLCPTCDGAGVKTEGAMCPDCLGSARLTTIDMDRVRVRWCSSCRGRGVRRVLTECPTCGGTGTSPGQGSV